MYETKYGLLKRWKWELDTIENEALFALDLYILKGEKSEELTWFIVKCFNIASGLYENHIDKEVLKSQPKISRDQALCYAVWAYLSGNDNAHKIIWRRVEHYDLPLNDRITIGLMNGELKSVYFVLFIQLFITWLFSYLKFKFYVNRNEKMNFTDYAVRKIKESSSLKLWWYRVHAVGGPMLKKWFSFLCKVRFGSVNDMIIAFYSYDFDHPVVKALGKDNE